MVHRLIQMSMHALVAVVVVVMVVMVYVHRLLCYLIHILIPKPAHNLALSPPLSPLTHLMMSTTVLPVPYPPPPPVQQVRMDSTVLNAILVVMLLCKACLHAKIVKQASIKEIRARVHVQNVILVVIQPRKLKYAVIARLESMLMIMAVVIVVLVMLASIHLLVLRYARNANLIHGQNKGNHHVLTVNREKHPNGVKMTVFHVLTPVYMATISSLDAGINATLDMSILSVNAHSLDLSPLSVVYHRS